MKKVEKSTTYEGFVCPREEVGDSPNKDFFAWGTPPLAEEDMERAEEPEKEMGIGNYSDLGRAWGDMVPGVRSKISDVSDADQDIVRG